MSSGQHKSQATVNTCMGTIRHSTDPDFPGWGHIMKQWIMLSTHLSLLSLKSGSATLPGCSRTCEVYVGFHVLDLCHPGHFVSIWTIFRKLKFSGTTRKSGAATGKYKLLPARSYWRLLRTGKMIFQALFKTSLRKSESNLPVSSSTSTYLVFVPQKNPRMNIIMYQFNPN